MEREKKAGVAILISDKIDFKRRIIKRGPEGHFIILKGRIHQEDINIVNIYAFLYVFGCSYVECVYIFTMFMSSWWIPPLSIMK